MGRDEPDLGQPLGGGPAPARDVEQGLVEQAQGLEVDDAVARVQEYGVHGGAVAVGDEHGCGHREERDLHAQFAGARLQAGLEAVGGLAVARQGRGHSAEELPAGILLCHVLLIISYTLPGVLAGVLPQCD